MIGATRGKKNISGIGMDEMDLTGFNSRGEVVPFDITGKLKADSVGSFEKFYIYCFNDLVMSPLSHASFLLSLVWCS
tara:strand:+ start:272 stop:502 length:231 start_codon:yes stop_codon:yes gene_type:complete